MTNRFRVGSQNQFTSGQRHHQRQHRAARHVEVRHHSVDQFETKARIDEQSRESFPVAGNCVGFKRADCAGADRDHPSARSPGQFYSSHAAVRNRVPFRFHRVTFNFVRSQRYERARANMESYRGCVNAALIKFTQKFGCEVNTCGRCSDGAWRIRINGLIIGEIRSRWHAANIVR